MYLPIGVKSDQSALRSSRVVKYHAKAESAPPFVSMGQSSTAFGGARGELAQDRSLVEIRYTSMTHPESLASRKSYKWRE